MTKIEFVDLKRQLNGDPVAGTIAIGFEIASAIDELVKKTSFMMGPYLESFERAFASYCGTKYCVGLNSGTDALEFALRCNGITSGKVITIPNSYFTTASSINQAGATPVFVDVDRKTFNIDIGKLEEAIDEETKAILLVHLYGRPCEMDKVMEIADKYKLKVIEDCAHSPGARYKVGKVPVSKTGCFSFFPGKNIGAWGDAGALVTNDEEVYKKARLWRNDGWEEKYKHEILGRKARLDPIQAQILSVKLKYLDKWNESRREHAKLYNNLLEDVKEIQLPLLEDEKIEPVFHIYNIITDKREDLRDYLTKNGIAVGVHYPTPIHLQPAYAFMGLKEGSFPVAEELAKKTLSLPMFPELRDNEIRYICDRVKEFFGK